MNVDWNIEAADLEITAGVASRASLVRILTVVGISSETASK